MIAKVVRTRRKQATSPSSPCGQATFAPGISYICRKSSEVRLVNLAGTWRNAANQMAVTAALNPRCRQASYHLVLSWAASEAPDTTDILQAAHEMLHHLQAAEHQAVIAVHTDRPHPHAHVILNRIHPLSGRSLALRHDYATLERACRLIERRMSWPADRGRYDVAYQGSDLHLVPKPPSHWAERRALRNAGIRADGMAIRGPEYRTGLPALRDAIASSTFTRIRDAMSAATSWQALHRALRTYALRYLAGPTGGRITHDSLDWSMPAGHLGAAHTLPRLQQRLGRYRGADSQDMTGSGNLPIADFMEELRPAFQRITTRLQRHFEHRQARLRLKQVLDRGTDSLRRSLGGRRTPFAIAMRRVREDMHRRVWRNWNRKHPSLSRPVNAMLEIEQASPTFALRRRYRALFRGRNVTDPAGRYPDYTAMRQAWCLAGAVDPPPVQAGQADLSARYPDQIRHDGMGGFIIPLRQGPQSITGFRSISGGAEIQESSQGQGLAILGPPDSKSAIVTSDVAYALGRLAQEPSSLVIIVDHDIDFRAAGYFKELLQDKEVSLVTSRLRHAAWQPSVPITSGDPNSDPAKS